MDSQTLQQRIRLGEDSTLELKRIVFQGAQKVIEPHPDGLSDELAAVANANGGTLVLGVDDKTLTATGIPAEQMETLKSWLRGIVNDRITPPLEILTENVELPNAAGEMVTVIVVSVPRSLWIHESANGYFRRVADSKHWLSAYDLENAMMQRGLSWTYIRYNKMGVPSQSHAVHVLTR
jgi:predicted HTH transcriptional regulator